MTPLRLDPPLGLTTPKGFAWCHIVKDFGLDGPCLWVCFHDDGQIWEWPTQQVRAYRNFSAGRPNPERVKPIVAVDRYKQQNRQKRQRRRKTTHTNARRRV